MSISDKKNVDAWSNEILKNVMLYPNERVVAALGRNYKNFENNIGKNALDVGFGSGRHLKLLMDYKFNAYGMDYSEEATRVARENLGSCSLLKELSNEDFSRCEFENDFFEFIIAFGVMFLRKKDEMRSDIAKISQILKKDGKMIINFRSKETFFYGMGEEICEDTFVLDERAGAYEGMTYTFMDLDEAKTMLEDEGFIIENIERDDYWKNNLKEKHSWWIFTVRKG